MTQPLGTFQRACMMEVSSQSEALTHRPTLLTDEHNHNRKQTVSKQEGMFGFIVIPHLGVLYRVSL